MKEGLENTVAGFSRTSILIGNAIKEKVKRIMVLKFNNVEKRLSDSLVFPAFNLHIRWKPSNCNSLKFECTKYAFTDVNQENTRSYR